MKKLNRTCVVDKKQYHYCSSRCNDSLNSPVWMMSFCSENCKNIYDACSLYNAGKLTLEDARRLLGQCDLSDKVHFTPATQRIIDEICHEDICVVEVESEEQCVIDVVEQIEEVVAVDEQVETVTENNDIEEVEEIIIENNEVVMAPQPIH